MDQQNIALGKPALQSSLSSWSGNRTIEEDAAGGNNGKITGEAGFHTSRELRPWWQVDLEEIFVVDSVSVFNRNERADRLRKFSLYGSLDRENWFLFFRKDDNTVFGSHDLDPFIIRMDNSIRIARYLRLQLDGIDFLHFSELAAYGHLPTSKSERDALNAFERLTLERREARGRLRLSGKGDFVRIDDFELFCDEEKFGPRIATQLHESSYEFDERRLVRALVTKNDRILELGCAIGVVTMTAADIVGPKQVFTWDANPLIVAVAQEHFRLNGLAGISVGHGALSCLNAGAKRSATVRFGIAAEFWASRILQGSECEDFVHILDVPLIDFEEEATRCRANVLICDIEGGEADLLPNVNLAQFRLIILELHPQISGNKIHSMIRFFYETGWNIDFGRSANNVIALMR